MKFLHYDSLTSQLSNEMIKIKTEENNLGKYYSKANFLKINVFKTNFQKMFMIVRESIKKNYPKLRNKTKR